ncbi:MAG: ATP synthase subunit I [Clostridia bacterium]|nr:ATP synthase subunit I [Clostridia bacterium]
MTKNVKTDVLRVTAGNFILGAVMVLIFALTGQFSLSVLWGAILGNSFVSLSFLWLAVSVSKNVEKDPKNAQQRVSATYTYRLLAAAAVILIAVKFDMFNWVSTVIPLFYQRIVVMVAGKMRAREDNREVKAE